jgi:hypothetical protein
MSVYYRALVMAKQRSQDNPHAKIRVAGTCQNRPIDSENFP